MPEIRRSFVNLLLVLAALPFACAPAATSALQTPQPAAATLATPTDAAATRVATETPASGLPVATEPAASAAAPLAQAPAVGVDQPSPASSVEFSGLHAKLHVDVLAREIGSRPAGSDAQGRAQQYVLGQLRALGYEAQLQPFPIAYYDDRGSALTIGGAFGRELGTSTLIYSPGGVVEGELVDAGLGRIGDFSPDAVRGKIALVGRGAIRFSEKVESVAAAGALAAIIYNNQPGNFAGNLATIASIPAVGLSEEEGQTLAQTVRRESVTARLSVDAGLEQRTAANVVATKHSGAQSVVIGGHLDSVPGTPGANDNASGTAVMLELARVLAARPTPYTLRFVAFDAEEIGLLGSAFMVGEMGEPERSATRAMINLDMVGVGDAPRLGGSDELTRVAFPIAASLGEEARPLGDSLNGASDHASFLRVGIPALFLYRSEDPNYHSPADRAELVHPAHLEYAGRLALGVLDALGGPR